MSATELAGLLERDEVLLVDVREVDEREIVTIPGSVHVPLARFRSGEAAGELPAGRPVVLHCKVGGRSAEALGLLRAAGRDDVRHLDGGVLAWVRDVDPSCPRTDPSPAAPAHPGLRLVTTARRGPGLVCHARPDH